MIVDAGQSLTQLREIAPLVQLITNSVSMNIAANTLIALGASPAMVQAPEEAPDFVRDNADALVVNIGTLSMLSATAMSETAQAANKVGKPWIFDPVAVGATSFRREVSEKLLSLKPTIIRANASEIRYLSGSGGAGRGVDARDLISETEGDARKLARKSGAVVAMTGPVDFVTDGDRAARVIGGHALMPKVTALGCALTGVTAAFAATAPPFQAAIAALAAYSAAGALAGAGASGPGSFAVAFLDVLYGLSPEQVSDYTQIEVI